MAHRLTWLLGLGAASAVTVLVATVDLHPWMDSSPTYSRESDLRSELWDAQARLSEATHIDSLLPLLPAQPGVRVMLAPFVDAAVAASIHASAAQQLAELGTPRARAGIFVVPLTLGLHPGLRDRPATRYTYYAGTDDGGAYCFVVAAARASVDSMLGRFAGLRAWRDSVAEPLGPCFYWARYGVPGARMQQWLRESGYRFAELRQVRRNASDAQPVRRRIFGRRDWSGRSLLAEACLSGDEQACVRALMVQQSILRYVQLPPDAPAVYERPMYRDVPFGEADRALLAELERAFGPERFAEFWRSNEPLDAAFSDAFVVSLGDWVHEWALQYYPAAPPVRAAVNLPTLLLSLLAIAALCGAAVSTAPRRQVS
jgi:hypothetical protein